MAETEQLDGHQKILNIKRCNPKISVKVILYHYNSNNQKK